jgi:acetylornithine deacetylase
MSRVAEWESRLLEAADHSTDRLVTLLQELVQIPSVSGDEGPIAAAVATWAASGGFDHRIVEPDGEQLSQHPAFTPPAAETFESRNDVIVHLRSGKPGRSIALLAHTDVVPVDPNTTWSHDPWSGDLEDGKIYGRGSADCKGGAAVAMVAFEIFRDLGVPFNGDLQAQFVIEEEQGGNGTLAAILAGERADAMIQLEPTSTDYVLVSNRGAQFFQVEVPGVEGGVEYQHDLASAIDNAFVIIEATKAYSLMREAQAKHDLYEGRYRTKVPLAICRIASGEWPSTVPGKAILEGTIECLPGEDIEMVVDDFEAYLRRAADQHHWLKDHPIAFKRFGLHFEAAETAPDSPIVKTIMHASKSALGRAPEVVGGGGSDLRLPVLYADCPTVLYGPGGGMIHSVDEYVTVSELVDCLKVTLLVAYRWLIS